MTSYTTHGTCSREIRVELDGTTIKEVKIIGGCPGNTIGVAELLRGMDAHEAIQRTRGIRCGAKPTSCPDQVSYAIEKALNEAGLSA